MDPTEEYRAVEWMKCWAGRLRPVDFLPLLFVFTVLMLLWISPHPARWDTQSMGAWMVFTMLWVLIVAVPTFVRFDRHFFSADMKNLPGHVLLIVLSVVLLFTQSLRDFFDPIAVAILVLICALVYGLGRGQRQFTAQEFLFRWSPIILSFYMYENLRWFVASINPTIMDPMLAAWDLRLFGVHFTLITEQWQSPWLTEWFSLHYASYILYPLVTGTLLYYHDHRIEFEDFILAFGLTMYLGFLGYLLVPAVGPISGLLDLYQTATVEGMALSDFRTTVVEKYRYIRDAFPSLHAANSLLCVFTLRRLYPKLVILFVIGEINLLLSTVYLRMHYTVDLIAGVLLVIFTFTVAPRLNRWLGLHQRLSLPLYPKSE